MSGDDTILSEIELIQVGYPTNDLAGIYLPPLLATNDHKMWIFKIHYFRFIERTPVSIHSLCIQIYRTSNLKLEPCSAVDACSYENFHKNIKVEDEDSF